VSAQKFSGSVTVVDLSPFPPNGCTYTSITDFAGSYSVISGALEYPLTPIGGLTQIQFNQPPPSLNYVLFTGICDFGFSCSGNLAFQNDHLAVLVGKGSLTR
jgi:hypothetical protein